MKKNLLLIAAFLSPILLHAGTIPDLVQKAFDEKFPGAKDIKWDKENAHEYEASFIYHEIACSANFSENGEWLETETTTSYEMLPLAVKQAFEKAHQGALIKTAAKIETAKGTTKFEVEYRQHIKTIEALYNADGTPVK